MALFGLGSIPKEIFKCRVMWKVVADCVELFFERDRIWIIDILKF